jgi:ribosomal-protein-alanine N-acetyltransferase
MSTDRIDCGVCLLRGWRKSDKASLVRHANNLNVSRHLRHIFPFPYTKADADAWLRRKPSKNAAPWRFAIEVNGEAVGGIGLDLRKDIESHSAEIGYWLSEDFWGHGIMTAAVKEVTSRALASPHFYRLCAYVSAQNPASMRVLEKAGYKKEGVLVRSGVKHGVLFDQLLYAITRDPGLPYISATNAQ